MKFLQQSFSYLKPTVLDKLEAHCLDKRAYLCQLLRRLEDDWICFPGVSKARHCLQYHAKDVYIRTHAMNGTRGCVVKCKIELTFVKLRAAYYNMCSARLIPIYRYIYIYMYI